MKNRVNSTMYLMLTILYLELVIKKYICTNILDNNLIIVIISTIPIVILLTILTRSFNKIINKIILFISTLLLVLYFEVQLIFYKLMSTPFSFSTMSLANQAADFKSIIKDSIITNIIPFILILIPLLLLIIFITKINTNRYNKYQISTLILMLITSYLSSFIFIMPNKVLKQLYNNIDDSIELINNFGLVTYTKINLKRELFGYNVTIIEDNNDYEIIYKIEEQEIDYGNNILELNFEETNNKKINELNNYFINKTPTNKNEYTGMFKDKNLIFILAEGFNEIAVDETRTPTLYKLVNNGFVFKNFYSPVYLSTTGGEFQATTGLIPTQEVLKYWKENKPTIEYALGNSFKELGYNINAYHDWTYTYYKRNITMKTLGYDNYTGCGNGLEKQINCSWLPKDTEMINATTPDYLNKEQPFLTYYVTISGHSPYNSSDNISKIYLDQLSDTNYSSGIKYYLSAQMELDRALEQLIKNLEESGQLQDTVIALVGDHYPYTLSTDEVNEVSNYQKDGTIEINRSNFILWNSEMKEPIIINKVSSQIDVLPTLLNLFGIDYDSRLIVGKDILSNYSGLAIFSNRSWVSDYGTYNSTTKTFIKKEDIELDDIDKYINQINNRVSNSFSISKMLIESDYYNYILNK